MRTDLWDVIYVFFHQVSLQVSWEIYWNVSYTSRTVPVTYPAGIVNNSIQSQVN